MVCVRYKKNLKALYVVHPTTFIRVIWTLFRPFIRYKCLITSTEEEILLIYLFVCLLTKLIKKLWKNVHEGLWTDKE